MSVVVSKLKVAQLKAELAARNLPTTGLKAVLSERLQQALDQEATPGLLTTPPIQPPQSSPPLTSEKRARSPSLDTDDPKPPSKIANRTPHPSTPKKQPTPRTKRSVPPQSSELSAVDIRDQNLQEHSTPIRQIPLQSSELPAAHIRDHNLEEHSTPAQQPISASSPLSTSNRATQSQSVKTPKTSSPAGQPPGRQADTANSISVSQAQPVLTTGGHAHDPTRASSDMSTIATVGQVDCPNQRKELDSSHPQVSDSSTQKPHPKKSDDTNHDISTDISSQVMPDQIIESTITAPKSITPPSVHGPHPTQQVLTLGTHDHPSGQRLEAQQSRAIKLDSVSSYDNIAADNGLEVPQAVLQATDMTAIQLDDGHPPSQVSNNVTSQVDADNTPSIQPTSSIEVNMSEKPKDRYLNPPTVSLPPINAESEKSKTDHQIASSQQKTHLHIDSDQPPPTRSVYIRNLVRPLTINQLKKKLSEFGTIEFFWIDAIRSHAYVTFTDESAAFSTYSSMHQTSPWPPETGKILTLVFIPEKLVQRLVAEEEEGIKMQGLRLGLQVSRDQNEWKFELRAMNSGGTAYQQPRGLASSIPSSQINKLPPQNFDQPKEGSSSRIHDDDDRHHRNSVESSSRNPSQSVQIPDLEFDRLKNYPKGGPEKWFKKTQTKPHLFYLPYLPLKS